ncbi:hypothetical protein H4Q26_006365 [Puccinia striiformis f. sp. tritici PST-130]|nr:hypothetical protein H4Q26_006365 [Puccinia striiformis f. sp. tritici PST-130]
MKHSILLLLIIGQSFIMGMHPPTPKLASLEQESPVGYRDGTFYSSSPPRAVELLPANGVSIDMPSSDDVKSSDGVKSYYDIKSYDEMTRWYDAYHKRSTPEESAINTYPQDGYARGIPLTSDVAITRNRDIWDTNSDAYTREPRFILALGAVLAVELKLPCSLLHYEHTVAEVANRMYLGFRNSYPPCPRIKFNSRHNEILCIPPPNYWPIRCNGDAFSHPELASLERETRFGYRDGPFYSSSPPRAVEPLPVNGFTIDIPSSDDVKSYDGGKSYDGVKSYYDIKSYDEMTRWYDAQHKPSPPKKSAINTYPVDEYARGIPLTSEVAFIRNRDIWDTNSEACCYIKLGCWVFGVLAVITAAILLTLWRIAQVTLEFYR